MSCKLTYVTREFDKRGKMLDKFYNFANKIHVKITQF